jgi:4-hydroxythreonine-4-phosphate dehydrogenase
MPGQHVLPLAISMGEPAGIGTEILLMAWIKGRKDSVPYFLIDDIERVKKIRDNLGFDIALTEITEPAQALGIYENALPVLHQPQSGQATVGRPDVQTAQSVISSIEMAVELTKNKKAGGIVTNPIQKSILYQAGFEFPGHTEFLGQLGGSGIKPVMMLACEGLRVVPITVHTGLIKAVNSLSIELIVKQSRIVHDALRRDFAIANPRLAVAGLNPHAGEDGSMGSEERDIILPAISILQAEGIDVGGPYPPDTLFTERTRSRYDAAICMYHDQALIPIKTLDFDGGVNITLGLPFVRTSPDHGTALEIAGKGIASPRSMLAAIKTAGEMAHHRSQAID